VRRAGNATGLLAGLVLALAWLGEVAVAQGPPAAGTAKAKAVGGTKDGVTERRPSSTSTSTGTAVPSVTRPGESEPVVAGASVVAAAVAAGRHWRLTTGNGPVHVWVPAGYHADGAVTVVYVHGYYTDVDHAWSEYQLPEQFALSAINAVFIAPEAPSGSRPPINWRSLGDLLRTVHQRTEVPRPAGPVVAFGHSGAYRTLMTWLDYPLLETLVLLDAMYGEIDPFRDWLEAGPHRRLVNVGDDTVLWTEELAHDLPMLEIDRVPPDQLPAAVRGARAVYIRSQLGHMPLVTDGLALPQLLRALPVELLPDAPWDQPLGVLPRGQLPGGADEQMP